VEITDNHFTCDFLFLNKEFPGFKIAAGTGPAVTCSCLSGIAVVSTSVFPGPIGKKRP
jgi:hypothetical protein